MKKITKWLKYLLWLILILIVSLVLVGVVFLNTSPEFGGSPTNTQVEIFKKSGHYIDGAFVNIQETTMDIGFDSIMDLFDKTITGSPNQRPDFDIPVLKVTPNDLLAPLATRLIWFGHSAFLLQIDGANILLDPMLGDVPAPSPLLGANRFSRELPIEIEELPQIDAIIISHDHYDHLDYGSIEKLKSKTKMFFVPLGVGAHFESWGINAKQIVELDWWESASLNAIQISLAPSRHFSGRGITNRNSTLWGSWIIKGTKDNIYFSGDGGYGPHFKEIGEKYGPFDLAMMECGQYNTKWGQIHMMPEQSAQAGVDVRAKLIMPIHWGAFTLSLHSWTDPVDRIVRKANELNVPIITPKIGEEIYLHPEAKAYSDKWWIKKD
ncbi:MAG: L-ascorbate metabolism protein UlaG (beta-lactamase superfamily) [Halieaceae bacterium]|jgi:L-ascorbate metabolism protein UlaG (beta-lactamase superfamily)